MIEKLRAKMEELSKEATEMVEKREQLMYAIDDINVRLTQIAGAMKELDDLLKNCETETEIKVE